LLLGAGSLWNTMVVTGRASALWQLARRHIPRQTDLFEQYLCQIGYSGERGARATLYRQLLPADFSREVLQAATGLAVVPLADAGWFDCGTPERLLEWLRTTPEMEPLLSKMQSALRIAARKQSAVPQAAVA
jgi:hypothetical protein